MDSDLAPYNIMSFDEARRQAISGDRFFTKTFLIVVVETLDPVIAVSTILVLVLALVTTIAVLVPAIRAARLNPCDALRSE